jgi:hypothetical protein
VPPGDGMMALQAEGDRQLTCTVRLPLVTVNSKMTDELDSTLPETVPCMQRSASVGRTCPVAAGCSKPWQGGAASAGVMRAAAATLRQLLCACCWLWALTSPGTQVSHPATHPEVFCREVCDVAYACHVQRTHR